MGLNVNQVQECLDQYTVRFIAAQQKKEETAFIAGGIVAGVAAEIFCICSLIKYVHREEEAPLKFVASLLGTSGFGPLIAVGAWCGVVALASWMITARKTAAIDRVKLQVNQLYQNGEALIEKGPMAMLLKIVDLEAAKTLIEKMNFIQLFEAKKTLGTKVFTKLISDVKHFSHGLWREILEVAPTHLPDFFESENVKLVQYNHPEMWVALKDRFQDNPEALSQVEEHLFSLIETEAESSDTISINIGEKKISLNKELLCKNSGYFRSLKLWREGEKNELDLTDIIQANPDFEPLLEIIAGKKVAINSEMIAKLIPFAAYFQIGKMNDALESVLIMNDFDFDFETLCELSGKFPEYPNLRHHLEQNLIEKMLTDETFDAQAALEEKLKGPKMQKKLQEYCSAKLTALLSAESVDYAACLYWVKKGGEMGCEDIKDKLPLLSVSNFRAQYEIALEFKDTSHCLDFCRQHAAEIKDLLPWKIEEMPNEVAVILFPRN